MVPASCLLPPDHGLLFGRPPFANMLAEDRYRLEKIDKLYDLRLDRYVALPMVCH